MPKSATCRLLLSLAATVPTAFSACGGPQGPEYVRTPSGLEYRVLRAGDGKARPTAMDRVRVHYRGRLLDGTVFETSEVPATFAVTAVIRGWTEGLQLMTQGSKFEFKIPPELAYGNQAKSKIPANSTLIFAVELLDVIAAKVPVGLPTFAIPPDGAMQKDASGIEYCFYKVGSGTEHPQVEDKVEVKFSWWTAAGVTIRSTQSLKGSLVYPVGQPHEGWTRALQLMTTGAHGKFKIPAKLGYGDVRPRQVPPNSDLILEIELLEILPGPRFYDPRASELQRTALGTRYAVMQAGNPQKRPGTDGLYTLAYAAWTRQGKFIESTFTHGPHLSGKSGEFGIPFINEIPPLMGEGARWVVICDPATQFPRRPRRKPEFDEVCLWQLHLKKVSEAPPFVRPEPSELRRSPSGLQFQALKTVAGPGQHVGPTQTAVTIMTAWLPSGVMIDTSIATPTGHRVWRMGSVPSGIREALLMMKIGETYRFVISAALRQGERRNPRVPDGSDIIYLIELIGAK